MYYLSLTIEKLRICSLTRPQNENLIKKASWPVTEIKLELPGEKIQIKITVLAHYFDKMYVLFTVYFIL